MRILVTGATGFIGTRLVHRLTRSYGTVRGAVRRAEGVANAGFETVVVGDCGPNTDWRTALVDVDVVVHLAARVHVMSDTAVDPLSEFRRVNTQGTARLAIEAADARVRRFIFLSSVKVHGEQGVFGDDSVAAPADPYSRSKYEAELALHDIAARSGMATVVLRSPLVYGPGVGGNFRRLITAVERGLPLPFGAVRNSRSLIALDNLVDVIASCVNNPAAANQTFLVSDGEDLSTPELVRRLARAMKRPARLIPVPVAPMLRTARLVGREGVAQRLLGSLQVDSSRVRRMLCWLPPIDVNEGIRRTVHGR